MEYLLLLLGFAILISSGELLVKGAVGIALRAKISPLVVGLTIVSIGTSSPELFASIKAATLDKSDISIGNVVGSNIANLALVLAITALIRPIFIDKSLLRQEYPMLLIATLAFYIFGYDGNLSAADGLILFSIIVFFTIYLIVRSRWTISAAEKTETGEELQRIVSKPFWRYALLVVAGCIGLYYGAEWFLKGAIQVAVNFGISDHIIGVTIVAFGTSIPELAASGIAAIRNQGDISIGNLIGSNIFNIFGVLGITSMISPLPVSPEMLNNDFFWMLGIAILLFPIMYFGNKVSRLNAAILLSTYIAYIGSFFILHN